jgi:hypothetical protein
MMHGMSTTRASAEPPAVKSGLVLVFCEESHHGLSGSAAKPQESIRFGSIVRACTGSYSKPNSSAYIEPTCRGEEREDEGGG